MLSLYGIEQHERPQNASFCVPTGKKWIWNDTNYGFAKLMNEWTWFCEPLIYCNLISKQKNMLAFTEFLFSLIFVSF